MLALYDFTSYTASSNSGAAPASTDPNVTASNYAPNGAAFLAAGGGSGSASNYFFTGSGNPNPGVGTQSSFVPNSTTDETPSVTAGTYYALTLTPATGFALSFNTVGGGNTFAFDFRVRNTTAGSTATPFTENLVLRSSLDNYATDIGTTVTGTQGTANGNTGFIARSFSLTTLGTLPVGTAITFRMYPFDNQNSAQDDFTVDNLAVNGTAVPESSSVVALLGGGIAGLTLPRRRRR